MKKVSGSAIKILLGLNIAGLLFHACTLLKLIPYDVTWSGKLKNDTEMYRLEFTSVLINLFFCLILLMKGNYTSYQFPPVVIKIILWVCFVLFVFSTVANLFAKTNLEKSFAILTFIYAILIGMVLRNKDKTLVNTPI